MTQPLFFILNIIAFIQYLSSRDKLLSKSRVRVAARLLYLLQFGIVPRLSRDMQQLFFVFLHLLLEAHVLLADHSLKLQQLGNKQATGSEVFLLKVRENRKIDKLPSHLLGVGGLLLL